MAFPRFNQTTGAVTAEVPNQWQKQWLDEKRLLWHDGTRTLIDGTPTGQKSYNVLAAGAGRWVGSFQPRIFASTGVLLEATGGDPYMDSSGVLVYVRPFTADAREIVKVLPTGALTVAVPAKQYLNSARIVGDLITYRATGGLYAQYKGVITRVPPIGEDVFWPVPFFVHGEPWVLTQTHTGYVLRPIDSVMGYRFDNDGRTHNPDVWFNAAQQTIRVVYGLTQGGGTTVRDHPLSLLPADVRRIRPPDPPEPPPMITPKATITSYEAEVTLPDTAHAVAKITQGTPDSLRWQYHDGDWTTAAEKPTSDPKHLEHDYVFAHEGRFPIRLQTLKGGEVTDSSSDTSRAVTVHAGAVEPPDPTIPTSQGFYLRAEAGQYACAEGGGGVSVLANRSVQGPWETFLAQDAKEGFVAIRTSTGHYFTVKHDQLWADATTVGATEKFKVTTVAAGVICLQDTRGLYVVAEEGGGGVISVRAPGGPAPGPWEKWATNLSGVPASSVRTGVVRGNAFQFVDDTGDWLPWGTSLFWALYGYLHERARVEAHLDWCKAQGMDYVRVICTGLRKGTTERSVSPSDPNFGTAISGLAALAYAKGLRVQYTIFGAVYDANSVAKRKEAVDKVGAALKGHGEKVWLVEIANEGSTNGFPGDSGAKELKDLATRLRSHIPNLIATTAVHGMDDIPPDAIKKYYANCPAATCQTLHFSRSTKAPDGVWRPTRKPWRESHFKVEGCCALVQNNEPRGPESSGTETNDPRVLAMDAAVTWLCGVGSYLLHTGSGIYGLDDPRGGGTGDDRPNNIWETQNIPEICAGIRTVQRLLPPTLPNFRKYQTNASGAPFAFKDTPDEQLTGAYSATAGPTIVQLPIGVVKSTTFHLKEGTCDGKVFHPVTGQVLEQFTRDFHVSPGQPGVVVVATKG